MIDLILGEGLARGCGSGGSGFGGGLLGGGLLGVIVTLVASGPRTRQVQRVEHATDPYTRIGFIDRRFAYTR